MNPHSVLFAYTVYSPATAAQRSRPTGQAPWGPRFLSCSGQMNCPCAKVFACGENACAAQKRRGPEGPLAVLLQRSCQSQISILTAPSKKKGLPIGSPFFLGSAAQRAALGAEMAQIKRRHPLRMSPSAHGTPLPGRDTAGRCQGSALSAAPRPTSRK